MLPRLSTHFLKSKCIIQDILPWKFTSLFHLKSLSSTSKIFNKEGMVKGTVNYNTKDLLDQAEAVKEDTMIPKVKPRTIDAVLPSLKPTKTAQIFQNIAGNSPNKQGFNQALEELKKKDLKKLRVTDFVPTALAHMEAFGVSKNLDAYNNLLGLFPRGRYHYRSVFDTIWTRYRPQIDTAIHLLTKMEENGVRPNVNTYDIIEAIFGVDSIPMNKVKRIVFWFDKFDTMYPHPLPKELPTDKLELFTLAFERMFGDKASITQYKDLSNHSMMVSTHTTDFQNKLDKWDEKSPLFVEGPYHFWMRKNVFYYYVLQVKVPHESEQDSAVAVCIVSNDGNDDKEHLKKWLGALQKNFPRLEKLNVIFNIVKDETLNQ